MELASESGTGGGKGFKAPAGVPRHRHDPGPVTWCQEGRGYLRPLLIGQHAEQPVARAGGQAVALGIGVELRAQGEGGRQVVGAIEQQRLAAPAQLLQAAWPAGCCETAAYGWVVDRPAPLP
jgi:hypothetical protein